MIATTMFVVYIEQLYANHTGLPNAAFTTRENAEAYKRAHPVASDVRIVEVPVDPAPEQW